MYLRISILLAALFANVAKATCEDYKLSAFADLYYAHELDSRNSSHRDYTTQAYYEDKTGINLLSLGYTHTSARWRSTAVAQLGDSAVVNYAAEKVREVQHIQEAFLGYKLGHDLWLDSGIFLSHIGPESWISKNNSTYLRSFIAENSPYYESGMRLSGNLSSDTSYQLLIVRGWQNISTNKSLAFGSNISTKLSEDLSITHSTFIGNENGKRIYSDFYVKLNLTNRLTALAAYDFGYQELPNDSAWWSGSVFLLNYKLQEELSFYGMAESFIDPEGVLISSLDKSNHFSVIGFSFGVDYQIRNGVLVRVGYRPLFSKYRVFQNSPNNMKSNGTVFVSIATWIN